MEKKFVLMMGYDGYTMVIGMWYKSYDAAFAQMKRQMGCYDWLYGYIEERG